MLTYSFPEGLAVDWVSRNLYITDPGAETIHVISLDNKIRSVKEQIKKTKYNLGLTMIELWIVGHIFNLIRCFSGESFIETDPTQFTGSHIKMRLFPVSFSSNLDYFFSKLFLLSIKNMHIFIRHCNAHAKGN